ncbi:MAG: HNH endonuclease [Bacteroidales bacterium]|nr:HNH endonuclease [Bacteroidales bacterium]
MASEKWTYDETIIALWTYCRIPFKESRATHPEVVRVAKIIGRSPAALNMKIGNIGRLDPSLAKQGIVGLTHGAKTEKEVWNDFEKNPEQLVMEAQRLLSDRMGVPWGQEYVEDLQIFPDDTVREVFVRQRIGQSFFRTAVLASYDNRCCISGVGETKLLEACHISDWAIDPKNRTNPQNGLCLNTFFHKAYDSNLIGISADYIIRLSDKIIESTADINFQNYILSLQGKKILLPKRFPPNKDLLAERYEQFLKYQCYEY